jgi:DNA-binding response OmpR family regulator
MNRILVIDDDFSVGLAIKTLLGHQSCDAVLAQSGLAGTEAFKTSSFDVVMVDLFMPGMDGLETIAGIRQLAPTVPTIAMSGFRFCDTRDSTPDFLDMAAKLGATYCLRKPFGPQQLMAAINACLDQTFSRDRAVGA